MDLILNITLGVAATFICFLAGMLFRSFTTLVFDKKPAARVWLARKNEPVEIVITSAPIEHEEEDSGFVYPTEAIAASEIALFLRDTFTSKTHITTSKSFQEDYLVRDLLIIGGPIHNELTRHFLEKLDKTDLLDGYKIISPDGKSYEAETSLFFSEERVTKDFGLIIRAPNPYNQDKRVTLLIGSRTAGTLIAARALIDPMIRPTAKTIHSGKSFHLLIAANVINEQPGKIAIEEAW